MPNKEKEKPEKIDPTIKYNGPVDDFRAWMDGFLLRASDVLNLAAGNQEEIKKRAFDEWKKGGMQGNIINIAQYYPRLIVKYSEADKSSNREVWHVGLYDPMTYDEKKPLKRWATILALQTLNITTVQFLDGLYFRLREPNGRITDYASADIIGDDFFNYAIFIKERWEEQFDKPDESAMQPFINKTLVFGQTFRNKDFYQTQEYGEMISLWNTLHKDPTFNLPFEVMRGTPDAIRLWSLYSKANNLHTSAEDDLRAIIREELARTREAMEILTSDEAKLRKPSTKRGANEETPEKIRKLAEAREKYIKENRRYPPWLVTCQSIPVDPETVKNYAPKLRDNWKDINYHWDGEFENLEN